MFFLLSTNLTKRPKPANVTRKGTSGEFGVLLDYFQQHINTHLVLQWVIWGSRKVDVGVSRNKQENKTERSVTVWVTDAFVDNNGTER